MSKLYPIGLVGCTKAKVETSCALPAKFLYSKSIRFRKSMAHLRKHGVKRWAILSAKYGVLKPAQVIETYDTTLLDFDKAEYEKWCKLVNAQLRKMFPEVVEGRAEFVTVLGKLYRGALEDLPYRSLVSGGYGDQNIVERWHGHGITAIARWCGASGMTFEQLRAIIHHLKFREFSTKSVEAALLQGRRATPARPVAMPSLTDAQIAQLQKWSRQAGLFQ